VNILGNTPGLRYLDPPPPPLIEIDILMVGVLCLAGAQSDAAHRAATTSCRTCLCAY